MDVANNHAAGQWAEGIRRLVQDDYPEAQRITLVMDNLNTHTGASLYKRFSPVIARSLLDKLEFVYTPKHGSWLNMAECEFSVLARQCLGRRLPDIETVDSEIDLKFVVFQSAPEPLCCYARHGSPASSPRRPRLARIRVDSNRRAIAR